MGCGTTSPRGGLLTEKALVLCSGTSHPTLLNGTWYLQPSKYLGESFCKKATFTKWPDTTKCIYATSQWFPPWGIGSCGGCSTGVCKANPRLPTPQSFATQAQSSSSRRRGILTTSPLLPAPEGLRRGRGWRQEMSESLLEAELRQLHPHLFKRPHPPCCPAGTLGGDP